MDIALGLLGMCAMVAWLLGAAMVARDVDNRGLEGRWVGLAWIFCPPLGLLLWLDARRHPRTTDYRS